jgi:hypothetical protein
LGELDHTCRIYWWHVELERCRSDELRAGKLEAVVNDVHQYGTRCHYPSPTAFGVVVTTQQAAGLNLTRAE